LPSESSNSATQPYPGTAVGGYTATAVLSSLIGVAGAAWQVGLLRTGAWVARGLRVPSRSALLADAVAPAAYGRAYGFERAMDNLGAIGGPLLALALVAIVGVREAILLSVIPGLIAALAIVFAIRHIPRPKRRSHQPLRVRIRPVLRGRLGVLMRGVGAFEIGNIAATLLILRATELLTPGRGEDTSVKIALGLYAGYNLAATVASIPAGRVSDRHGPRVILAAGAALFAAAYLLLAATGPDIALLAAGFALGGLGIACTETAEHAAVAAEAPTELRGSAFGLLAAAQSFGNLAASAIAGLLWTVVSPPVAFIYAAAWMVIAVGLWAAPGGRVTAPGA
jgi:MFS family permease